MMNGSVVPVAAVPGSEAVARKNIDVDNRNNNKGNHVTEGDSGCFACLFSSTPVYVVNPSAT